MVLHEKADLALATESLALTPGLATLPVYAWEHTVVVRPDHPLAELTSSAARNLTLAQLAEYPIVTYDRAFTGRSNIDEVFASQGLPPDIELEEIGKAQCRERVWQYVWNSVDDAAIQKQ